MSAYVLFLRGRQIIAQLHGIWYNFKNRKNLVELDEEDKQLKEMVENLDWSQAISANGRPHHEVHAELRARREANREALEKADKKHVPL
jgi:hypothetical protein